MITTVTLNLVIDRTIIVDDFMINHVNRIKAIEEDVGGKGIGDTSSMRRYPRNRLSRRRKRKKDKSFLF